MFCTTQRKYDWVTGWVYWVPMLNTAGRFFMYFCTIAFFPHFNSTKIHIDYAERQFNNDNVTISLTSTFHNNVNCGNMFYLDTWVRYWYYQTHTHTRFNGHLSGTTRVCRYQKGKPIWILQKQETVSDSGISWDICKYAPRSRQITMPAPHCSVFLLALPAAQPTASKALKAKLPTNQ